MPGSLPAGVLLDSLTSQAYDPNAELDRWQKLIFSFDMDPNQHNNPKPNPNPNQKTRQSADDIQTAALLNQLASTSDLFPLNPDYGAGLQRQGLFNPQQFISPMSLGPQGYDPRTAHPMYRGSPLPSPQLQPYNPQAIADTTRGARAAPPAHSQHAGPSTATTSSAADTDRDYVDDDYEDKRRRNTAASARFRIKKKMRGLELERSVSDLTGRAEELEREAADLRRENGWLKEIVMLKGGHLSGIDLSGGMAQQRSQEKRREEAQEESESESEKEHSGKDRKGKGKASSKKK